ncbi:MAG TPA: GNAT family N-acetyltransferase [Planctomycetota bacterium]|nr:GNAT family N-acetyltransferase [Planctomycetota bacterium]
MNPVEEIRTPRLLLRGWRDGDVEHFAELNADPRVMEHFPAPFSPAETATMVARIRAHFDEHGFGLWAVEVPGVAPFIGFTGLSRPRFQARFTPCVEVGWRLAFDHWGRGYATEAAKAALAFGFEGLGLAEIVSFTAPINRRSIRVMEKLGMTRNPADDFDHPGVAAGHPLRPHVLYRLASPLSARPS